MAEAEQTTSNYIREEVNKKRTTVNENQTQPVKNNNKTTPKTLLYINAATAVYRSQNAPKDKPFTPSAEQQKLFAEAQKTIAEKRGIEPDKDGKYTEDQLKKELSPLEVAKQFSLEHCRDAEDKKTAIEEINQEFQSVYSDEKDGPKEHVPEELSNTTSSLSKVGTFHTLNDFLALSPDEQQKYLESIKDFGAEVDYLTKALENQKNKKELGEHDAVDLGKTNEDPDNPHIGGGKDFKSSQKDIIEWMMEEIIVASLDWCGNRAVEFASWPIYALINESGKALKKTGKNYKERLKQKEADNTGGGGAGGGTGGDDNNGGGSTGDSADNDNKEKSPETPKEFLEKSFKSIEVCSTILKDPFSPLNADINTLKDITTHKTIFDKENNEILYKNPEKQTTIPTDYPYFNKSFDLYCEIQENLTAKVFEGLNEKLNPNNDETLKNDIFEWAKQKYQLLEKGTKEGKESGENPRRSENLKKQKITTDELKRTLCSVQNCVATKQKLFFLQQKMIHTSQYFACNYATYKILEMIRTAKTDEDKAKVADVEYLKEQSKLFEAEGKLLICQNFKNLRDGSKDAVSTEELLQLSEQMVETSKQLYEDNNNQTESPDLVTETLSRNNSQSSEEKQTLNEFSLEKLKDNDVYNIEKNDLYFEEESLKKQQDDTTERRKNLQKRKEKFKNTEKLLDNIFPKKQTQKNKGQTRCKSY